MLEFVYSSHFDLSAAEEIVRTCSLIYGAFRIDVKIQIELVL